MGVNLYNPDPDDRAAQEASSVARGLVKAYLDGESDFLVIALRDALSFIRLEHEGDLHEVTVAQAQAEIGSRLAKFLAASAALAAMAIDPILPEDDPEDRAVRMAAFFDAAREYTY